MDISILGQSVDLRSSLLSVMKSRYRVLSNDQQTSKDTRITIVVKHLFMIMIFLKRNPSSALERVDIQSSSGRQ